MSTVSKADLVALKPTSIYTQRLSAALEDLARGLVEWRVWWILAFNDIRQRYRRSTLGPFWLTISTGVMIAGIGVIYPYLFDQPIQDYVPFLGVGLVVWNLISGLINDLANSFISADTHLRSYPTPLSVVIYRTIARNLLISAHTFIIVPVLLLLFDIPVTWTALLALPAIGLIGFNSVWIGMLVGPLSARFRDLPQIIASVVQLAFFVTPIFFRAAQLQDRLWIVTDLNPFASFVEIVRGPLLGHLPASHHYLMVALCTLIGWTVAIPFYARFRGRVVYWL
jgi:ABC-type polysaccharide/polyol phosphate export permease